MEHKLFPNALLITAALVLAMAVVPLVRGVHADDNDKGSVEANAQQKVAQGRHIFRFDTFGDEAYWGGTLKLHQAIEGSKFGGVGPGISPRLALMLGLKVD